MRGDGRGNIGPTGRRRHRTNWRGKLILQVECHIPYFNTLYWRDATTEDVTVEPERESK